jgi:ATP-binding protein involved in chromosome partitioning
MNISAEEVIKALSYVEDPDLKKDLVTLGMVKDVAIDGLKVKFTVVLTTPACPLKDLIRNACITAIKTMVHKDAEVEVNMTANVTSGRGNSPILPGVKNIIAIGSGKGGVGKSTVTANLAVALARNGAKVGLIDADISGPSVPVMFNLINQKPQVTQVDGKTKIVPIEQYGIKLISIGFLADPDQAVVWRGPMASSALKQFMTECEWGELDYMLIDLPPGTGDIHLTMVQTVPVTGVVIVTTPQKVALADAQKGLGMFRSPQINVPILGIVENMSWFTPEELPDNKYFIFGKDGGLALSEKNLVPLLGQIPLVQSIRESGDNGRPSILENNHTAKYFDNLAMELARQVAIRNSAIEKTKVVEIKV